MIILFMNTFDKGVVEWISMFTSEQIEQNRPAVNMGEDSL